MKVNSTVRVPRSNLISDYYPKLVTEVVEPERAPGVNVRRLISSSLTKGAPNKLWCLCHGSLFSQV
jgi:hypothetical protein